MNRIGDYGWAAAILAIAALPSGAVELQWMSAAPMTISACCSKDDRTQGNSEPLATSLRLDIDLMPLNKTAVEPQDDRDFACSVEIANSSAVAVSVDVWVVVELPGGQNFGPVLLRKNLCLPAESVAVQEIKNPLPKNLPAGIYAISLQMGTYPVAVLAGDQLTFEKRPGEIRALKSGSHGLKRDDCNSGPASLH